jgi:hypothetical protein
MRVVSRVAVGVVVGLTLAGLAPAAHAAGAVSGASWVATPNGVVGVQESIVLKAPKLKGQVVTITLTAPNGASTSGQTVVNDVGFASLAWTPSQAGLWTVTPAGAAASAGTTAIAVAAMPTTSSLMVAGEVGTNVLTTVVVKVSALGGSIAPSGRVTVRDQFARVVTSGDLTPGSMVGESVANLPWTPSANGVALTATFEPSSTAFGSSVSTTEQPVVGQQQQVSIRMPSTMYVGKTASLEAVIGPDVPNGSAAFWLSIANVTSYPMGGSFPVTLTWGQTNGVGSTPWTPTQAGVQTVNVSFSTGNFSISAQDNQVVKVQPAPTADVVTLTAGGVGPWAPGSVGTLKAGTSVALSGASTSGAPVTLSTTGPCTINGDTLTVLSMGSCTVTAASLGNNGSLVASTSDYTIAISK